MSEKSTPNTLQDFFESLRRLATLQVSYARLTAAEKLSILLSTAAFAAVMLVLGTLLLLFISIGIGHLLATTVAPEVAYLYVAAFYLLVCILVFVFRKKLIVDPIARFVSKLFVNPDKD